MEPDVNTDDLARKVIGAALEVHKFIGPGFLESVYEEALSVELEIRGIPFERQRQVSVSFKDRLVGKGRMDFLVDSCLVVELKTVDAFAPIHTAVMISYLTASKLTLGLLINFNVPILKQGIRRVVRSDSTIKSQLFTK